MGLAEKNVALFFRSFPTLNGLVIVSEVVVRKWNWKVIWSEKSIPPTFHHWVLDWKTVFEWDVTTFQVRWDIEFLHTFGRFDTLSSGKTMHSRTCFQKSPDPAMTFITFQDIRGLLSSNMTLLVLSRCSDMRHVRTKPLPWSKPERVISISKESLSCLVIVPSFLIFLPRHPHCFLKSIK